MKATDYHRDVVRHCSIATVMETTVISALT